MHQDFFKETWSSLGLIILPMFGFEHTKSHLAIHSDSFFIESQQPGDK